MMRFLKVFLLSAGVVLAQTASKDACTPPPGSVPPPLPAKLLEGQGRIDFPITIAGARAQAFFNQGVAQMHSFWSREAERSFLEAAALDPAAPMPHWGIAMVAAGDFRPGFQLDLVKGLNPKPRPARKPEGGLARAVAAARKALELSKVDGAATRLEKLYIAAVAARRDLAAKDPNAGYVAGLRALVAEYPNQVEAASYLSLHIMSGYTTPDRKPFPGSAEAVSILRRLLAAAPDHAGVHHYVIHGWEGSSFAAEAWPSSKRYPELAPNIPHALHMPGHIYSQTGRWQDAGRAFDDAAANEILWMKQDTLAGNQHHGHNVHYLATVRSFNGQYEKAIAAAKSLLEFKETPREAASLTSHRTAYRQGWFALMRTLVQHQRWDEILDGKTLPNLNIPRQRAWSHWAMALAYADRGDLPSAKSEARKMDAALEEEKVKTKQRTAEQMKLAREELKGHLALASGDVNKAMALLRKAAEMEPRLRYNEPPLYPRPVYDALGQIALRQGNLALAESSYRKALKLYPEGAASNAGLRDVLQRQGKPLPAGM